jgi:hypothetical protein
MAASGSGDAAAPSATAELYAPTLEEACAKAGLSPEETAIVLANRDELDLATVSKKGLRKFIKRGGRGAAKDSEEVAKEKALKAVSAVPGGVARILMPPCRPR